MWLRPTYPYMLLCRVVTCQSLVLQEGAEELCRQVVDDGALAPRLRALRKRELTRGLDPELLRRYILYVRRYRYPVSGSTRRYKAVQGGILPATACGTCEAYALDTTQSYVHLLKVM